MELVDKKYEYLADAFEKLIMCKMDFSLDDAFEAFRWGAADGRMDGHTAFMGDGVFPFQHYMYDRGYVWVKRMLKELSEEMKRKILNEEALRFYNTRYLTGEPHDS